MVVPVVPEGHEPHGRIIPIIIGDYIRRRRGRCVAHEHYSSSVSELLTAKHLRLRWPRAGRITRLKLHSTASILLRPYRARGNGGYAVPRPLMVQITDVIAIIIAGQGVRGIKFDEVTYSAAAVSHRSDRVSGKSEVGIDFGRNRRTDEVPGRGGLGCA